MSRIYLLFLTGLQKTWKGTSLNIDGWEEKKEIFNTESERIGRKKPFAPLKSSCILNIYILKHLKKITLSISITVFYEKPMKFRNSYKRRKEWTRNK